MQLLDRTRRTPIRLAALALAAIVWSAGCSGDDGTTTVSQQSEQRPTTTAESGGGGGGDASDYCAAVEQLDVDSGGLDLSQDAEGALAGIERMADAAPAELSDAFDTFLGAIRELATLDEDDPNALTGILELATDPDFTAAADQIETYTRDECGIDLGATSGLEEDSMGEDSFDSGEGQIELEDIDTVKDENASSTWAEKLNTTVINFGRDVAVSSDAGALSVDEALEACDALLSSLGMIDSEVTVTVSAGETELARSENGLCVAS